MGGATCSGRDFSDSRKRVCEWQKEPASKAGGSHIVPSFKFFWIIWIYGCQGDKYLHRVLSAALCDYSSARRVSVLLYRSKLTAVKHHLQLVHMFQCDWSRAALRVLSGQKHSYNMRLTRIYVLHI